MEDELQVGDIVDIHPHWPDKIIDSIDGDTIWCFNQGDDAVVPFHRKNVCFISRPTRD